MRGRSDLTKSANRQCRYHSGLLLGLNHFKFNLQMEKIVHLLKMTLFGPFWAVKPLGPDLVRSDLPAWPLLERKRGYTKTLITKESYMATV